MKFNLSLKSLLKIFFYFFIAYFILSFYFYLSVSQASTIRASVLLGAFVFLVFYIGKYGLKIRYKYFSSQIVELLFLLFFLYLLFLCVFNLDWQQLRRLALIILFFTIIVAYQKEKISNFKYFYILFLFISVVVSVAYVYSFIANNGMILPNKNIAMVRANFDIYLDYGNSVIAGMHLSFLYAFCLLFYFKAENRLNLFFSYVSSYLLLCAVFLTFARTSWLVCFIVIITYFIYYFKLSFKRCVILLAPIAIMLPYYLYYFMSFHLDRGLTRRDEIWIAFIDSMNGTGAWLFGHGLSAAMDTVKLSTGNYQPHAHSIYVEVLYKAGLVGLVLFVGVIAVTLFKLHLLRHSDAKILYIALISSITAGMFFDYSNLLYSPNLMWLVFWLPMSLAFTMITNNVKCQNVKC